MKIYGMGTDIVEVEPFSLIRDYLNKPYTRCFRDSEMKYCGSKIHSGQHYAARFAAKEATLKALGRGLSMGMRNIEIGKLETGEPIIILHGKLAEEFYHLQFMVSISHTSKYATATVIAIC